MADAAEHVVRKSLRPAGVALLLLRGARFRDTDVTRACGVHQSAGSVIAAKWWLNDHFTPLMEDRSTQRRESEADDIHEGVPNRAGTCLS